MDNPTALSKPRRALDELWAAWLAYRRQSQVALANWLIVLMGLLILQSVAAITSVIVARAVAPVEYGQYLASLGLASLLIVLPSFGMDTLLLARGGLSVEQLAYLWLRLMRSRLLLLGLWLVAMALLALLLPASTYPFWVLWPTALALALESLVLLSHSALRSISRHGWVTVLQIAATVTVLGMTLGLRLAPGQIAVFSLGRAAVWALVTPLTLAVTWRILQRPTATLIEPPAVTSAAPFLVSDLAAAIYTRAPLTVVALFLGSAGAAAFGPAANLIVFTFLVPNALYFVVLPLLARLHRDRPHLFRRVGWVQLALQGAAGALISVVILLFGARIITTLLGANYATSVVSLLLLSPLPALKSLNFGLAAVLTSNERQTLRAVTQVICAVFNVVGSLLVVKNLGLPGVALVFNLTELLLLAGYGLGAAWPLPPAGIVEAQALEAGR